MVCPVPCQTQEFELSRIPERTLPWRRKTRLFGLFMPTSACVLLSSVHKRLVGRAGVPISASHRKLEIGDRGSTPLRLTPLHTRLTIAPSTCAEALGVRTWPASWGRILRSKPVLWVQPPCFPPSTK